MDVLVRSALEQCFAAHYTHTQQLGGVPKGTARIGQRSGQHRVSRVEWHAQEAPESSGLKLTAAAIFEISCTGSTGVARCAMRYSRAQAQPVILCVMKCCAYCRHEGTTRIVSTTQRVCLEHAVEFWTGLLAFARECTEHCVKHEGLCNCRSCEESSAFTQRAIAIAAAGPPPPDHQSCSIRLAS
jgi:hypothetical protein